MPEGLLGSVLRDSHFLQLETEQAEDQTQDLIIQRNDSESLILQTLMYAIPMSGPFFEKSSVLKLGMRTTESITKENLESLKFLNSLDLQN